MKEIHAIACACGWFGKVVFIVAIATTTRVFALIVSDWVMRHFFCCHVIFWSWCFRKNVVYLSSQHWSQPSQHWLMQTRLVESTTPFILFLCLPLLASRSSSVPISPSLRTSADLLKFRGWSPPPTKFTSHRANLAMSDGFILFNLSLVPLPRETKTKKQKSVAQNKMAWKRIKNAQVINLQTIPRRWTLPTFAKY